MREAGVSMARWGIQYVASVALVLAGCGGLETGSGASGLTEGATTAVIGDPTEADAEVAILVLPTLAAANSLLANSTTTTNMSKTIGLYNAAELPATPQACADGAGECTALGDGVMRFPSSGYLSSFYGQAGHQAYLTLAPTTDNWGIWRVVLSVYPTLSTDVRVTTEIYRLDDNWTDLIGTDGNTSAIGFEEISTSYFDTRQETRTLLWSRWVDNQSYPLPTIPDSFDDVAWDSIAEPTKQAVGDLGGGEDFASHTTYVITSDQTDCGITKEKFCITETGEEFYTLIPDGNGVVSSGAQSTNRKTTQFTEGESKDLEIVADTNTMYLIDSTGKKTVQAKTTSTYTLDKKLTSTTTTSTIITDDSDGDGLTNYDADMTVKSEESKHDTLKTYSYDYTLDLEETSSGSNVYSGTYVVIYTKTNGKTKIYTYTASLTIDGLALKSVKKDEDDSDNDDKDKKKSAKATDTDSEEDADIPEPEITFTTKNHYSAPSSGLTYSITLANGTLTDATYQGGLLYGGTFGGQKILIGEGFLLIDGDE
jgi:hypothetical protein